MIQIDDGVPMPPERNGPRSRYPFSEMEVGQSFLVGNIDARLVHSVRMAAYNAGLSGERKFSTRKTTAGLRVWRIK